MTTDVRRGLGLLVLAVLGLLVFMAVQGQGGFGFQAVSLVAGTTVLAGGIGGLCLLAWGLLRNPSR